MEQNELEKKLTRFLSKHRRGTPGELATKIGHTINEETGPQFLSTLEALQEKYSPLLNSSPNPHPQALGNPYEEKVYHWGSKI